MYIVINSNIFFSTFMFFSLFLLRWRHRQCLCIHFRCHMAVTSLLVPNVLDNTTLSCLLENRHRSPHCFYISNHTRIFCHVWGKMSDILVCLTLNLFNKHFLSVKAACQRNLNWKRLVQKTGSGKNAFLIKRGKMQNTLNKLTKFQAIWCSRHQTRGR